MAKFEELSAEHRATVCRLVLAKTATAKRLSARHAPLIAFAAQGLAEASGKGQSVPAATKSGRLPDHAELTRHTLHNTAQILNKLHHISEVGVACATILEWVGMVLPVVAHMIA